MKRLLNIAAWIIVSLILTWFYSCMKKDTKTNTPTKKPAVTPAMLKVIKTCGTMEGVIVRGSKVFCTNGTPVENVDVNDLKQSQ